MTEQGKGLMELVVDAYARPAFPHMRKEPTELERALDIFDHGAEYRMERADDARTLEDLGEAIGKLLRQANLTGRSNLGDVGRDNLTDAIHGMCDGLDFFGADIVRCAAIKALEE